MLYLYNSALQEGGTVRYNSEIVYEAMSHVSIVYWPGFYCNAVSVVIGLS